MALTALACFGAGPGLGNPALVLEEGPPDAGARLAFAHAQGQTCVFLDAGAAGMVADYYYPHARSVLCLHASLAAAHVLFARQPGATAIALRTAQRGQILRLTRQGERLSIGLARQPLRAPHVTAAQAAALLGMDPAHIVGLPQAQSAGSPKLLVEVAGSAQLHALRPDLHAILDWGRAAGLNGVYAYCRRGDDLEGRNFNHADPAMEDRATGVAAAALTLALGRALTVHQGGGCVMHTALEGEQVLLSGAVEVLASSRTI